MLDLFISVAYDYYYDFLNHNRTVILQPEEHKTNIAKDKKVLQTQEVKNAKSQNLKYPGKVLCIEK